ncbi:hypothetical protein [Paraburkholderia sp. A3RO-2L]|jgi:hypothetical protein|uniref:hypothetical protein n=1 Tax=unclassified Paraburkholderia TaxID=2615204 RepID=UPI0032FFBC95|nr:hypothetical protein [Burkholderia vietnamiensis]
MSKPQKFTRPPVTGDSSKGVTKPDVQGFLEGSAMVSAPAGRSPSTDLKVTLPSLNLGQSAADEVSIYKTVNVRLNRRRYVGLKALSLHSGKPMQDLLTQLVDALLDENKDKLQAGIMS